MTTTTAQLAIITIVWSNKTSTTGCCSPVEDDKGQPKQNYVNILNFTYCQHTGPKSVTFIVVSILIPIKYVNL